MNRYAARTTWQTTLVAICVVALLSGRTAGTPRDADLDKLTKAYVSAQETWFKKNKKVENRDYNTHPITEFMPKIRALAEKNPKSKTAVACTVWALENCRFVRYTNLKDKESYYRWALDMLKQNLATQESLESAIPHFVELPYHYGLDPFREFYEIVIRDNPSREAKAWATFALAETYCENYGDPASRNQAKREENLKKAATLFKKVVDDYGDTSVVDRARRHLSEVTDLRPGCKAPNIVGRNFNNEPVELSKFRGKTVVVDFWTSECSHCDEVHEVAKEIVKKHKGDDFLWLGINADRKSPDEVQKLAKRRGLDWPQIVDDSERSITKAWNVEDFPTIYIIDPEGIITHQKVDTERIRNVVEGQILRARSAAEKARTGAKDQPAPPPSNPAGITGATQTPAPQPPDPASSGGAKKDAPPSEPKKDP